MYRYKKLLLAILSLLMFAPSAMATANLANGYISDNARTQGEVKTALEQMVSFAFEQLGGNAESTLTISGNAVTPPANGGSIYKIDTSGGAGNLDNIVATNVPDGRLLIIRCANPGSNPVTVRHNQAGSIPILMADSANFTFASSKQFLVLKRTSTNFEEVSRSYGDQTAAFRTYLGLGTAAQVNTGTSGANVPTITQADARYAALAGSSSQAFNVAGSPTSNNAVNKTTADATYAAKAGSSSQTFGCATPSASTDAANKAYVDRRFTTTTITPTGGSTFGPTAHSLGVLPHRVWAEATCTATDGGWAVSDIIHLTGNVSFYGTGTAGPARGSGIQIYCDATNVSAIFGNDGLLGLNKSNGNAFALTPAKWTVKIYCEP